MRIAFERRCGRTEHDRAGGDFATHDGQVPSVVADAFFLLVGGVVLFVHDDEPEVADRRKDRGPRPDRHNRVLPGNPRPFLPALLFGHGAVQHADPTAEPLLGLREELVGQGNLRDEKNDTFPVPQRIFGRGQIDFGLSTAGHAVQQKDGETLSIEGAAYFVTRGLLGVGQPRTGGFGYGVG